MSRLPRVPFALGLTGAACLIGAIAEPARAQPPLKRLAAPAATFDEPFTTVTGLRELADGRVLAADGSDRTLQLLDLRTGEATSVGREGAGPGEWGVPSRLYALPGDSTLMSDFRNGRYLIILPNGRPGPTFRIAEGSPAASATLIGVDARGRLLLQRSRFESGAGPRASATGVIDVLRYDRATQRTDTVAQLAGVQGERSGARQLSGGMLQIFTNVPFAARDDATVTTDGRLVLVRASPYRVDWLAEDGRIATGTVAEASRIRITQAEKEAYAKSLVRPGEIIIRDAGGGAAAPSPSARASADAAAIRSLTNPDMLWPAEKPPFSGAVFGAPASRTWVLRSRAHDDPVPVYDVFDAQGRVVERVALPPRTRVVGFGRTSVYLVRMDDDDLQHLERHRLP